MLLRASTLSIAIRHTYFPVRGLTEYEGENKPRAAPNFAH
jgi:hypothetical protein